MIQKLLDIIAFAFLGLCALVVAAFVSLIFYEAWQGILMMVIGVAVIVGSMWIWEWSTTRVERFMEKREESKNAEK